MPAGRRITWTQDKRRKAIEDILEHVSKGNSVRSLLDKADRNVVPSFVTFCEWLNEDKELAKHYAQACEARSELIFDEILKIADDGSNDTKIVEMGDGVITKVDMENIQRSRLRVDARKWMLGKMNPKKYGDKLQQDLDITSKGESIVLNLGNGIKPTE